VHAVSLVKCYKQHAIEMLQGSWSHWFELSFGHFGTNSEMSGQFGSTTAVPKSLGPNFRNVVNVMVSRRCVSFRVVKLPVIYVGGKLPAFTSLYGSSGPGIKRGGTVIRTNDCHYYRVNIS